MNFDTLKAFEICVLKYKCNNKNSKSAQRIILKFWISMKIFISYLTSIYINKTLKDILLYPEILACKCKHQDNHYLKKKLKPYKN
ncbi:hypothetical protein BpHYR1_017046 [Brachionus plicatilis]|uniref:Uncharacterized protein n=1 Tax=Brachionus plicatilis TaxID=10195 RepID=A0A3M7SQM1_BRAPC|nr:hypothetical protein BpHYR1_017046 [Brachionus plicatilis]